MTLSGSGMVKKQSVPRKAYSVRGPVEEDVG